jgi:hypothetical protein
MPSDRGPQFASSNWKKISSSQNCRANLTPNFCPKCKGITERGNQLLQTKIRILSDTHPDPWSKNFEPATNAVNDTLNTAIKCSPNELSHKIENRNYEEAIETAQKSIAIIIKRSQRV